MNSPCNFLQMSLEKPSFNSQIPQHLLSDANDRDKYILNSLSIMAQSTNWTAEEMVKQSAKLEGLDKKVTEVDDKLKFTNGKIGNSMLQIKALEDQSAAKKEMESEMGKIVGAKLFVQKYLCNRYTLGILFVLGVGVLKVLTNNELRELFFKLVGLS